jgi:hypothetical protein
MPTEPMNPCYIKTDAGREEIQGRTRKLSRPARNLLLIIDERHPGTNWVQLVHGATDRDLFSLVAEGLVAHKHDVAPGLRLRSSRTLSEALAHLSFDQLYDLMTSQARDRLGLIRGFQFVLSIEKCTNVEELRVLALRFMELVQEHQGEAAARRMQAALGVAAA